MFPKEFIRKRRAVTTARRRNAEVADLIGARRGTLVAEHQTGGTGLKGHPGLGILTVRPGQADEVLQEQIDSAVAAGYSTPPVPPGGRGNGCLFPSRPGWPVLSMEVIPSGRSFRGVDHVVPAGRTGVIVSMYLPTS